MEIKTIYAQPQQMLSMENQGVRNIPASEEMVLISRAEYENLIEDQKFLNHLRDAGHERWDVWNELMQTYGIAKNG